METRIIQLTSGRGPAECCRVVALVLAMLLEEARGKGLRAEVIHQQSGPLERTLESATVSLTGDSLRLKDFLQSWLGTVCWIGRSAFRKLHKRRNWFIGIAEVHLPQADFSLDEKDIRMEAIRSGGPGGQHVNKVSTAIRATHIPTGISVVVSTSRSQLQNRKDALKRLEERLQEHRVKRLQEAAQKTWDQHRNLQRGNPIRTFTGDDFKSSFVQKDYNAKRKKNKQDWKNQLRTNDHDDAC